MRVRFLIIVPAVAIVLAAALLWREPASAAIDLTGTWSVESGEGAFSCEVAAVKQHGSDLYLHLCPPFGLLFSGTIDKGSGAFSVTATLLCKGYIEVPMTLTGTASPDGNSFSGSYQLICISNLSGTFSGTRLGPPTITFVPPSATPSVTPTATVPPTPTATPPPATPPPVGGVSRRIER